VRKLRGGTGGRSSGGGLRWVFDQLRELQKPLDVFPIFGLVQDHLVAQLAGVRVDVSVTREEARVHNRHVQALRDCVVQEDTMHCITKRVEAAEREGQVAQATTERDARAGPLDLSHRVDEVDPVRVVLWQACRNRQDVAVEDDVLRVEVKLRAHQVVRPRADPDLVFERGSLTLLIESHHDDSSTVALAELGLPKELLLTYFQGDRVHDALALHPLQALLDHGPLRRVNHEGQLRDGWLRHTHAHELTHGSLAIDQVRVEVEIENVRGLSRLRNAHLHCLVVLVVVHELPELR